MRNIITLIFAIFCYTQIAQTSPQNKGEEPKNKAPKDNKIINKKEDRKKESKDKPSKRRSRFYRVEIAFDK